MATTASIATGNKRENSADKLVEDYKAAFNITVTELPLHTPSALVFHSTSRHSTRSSTAPIVRVISQNGRSTIDPIRGELQRLDIDHATIEGQLNIMDFRYAVCI